VNNVMRKLLQWVLFVLAILGAPKFAQAQPILEGCTAFLNSDPQFSVLYDIDPLTGNTTNGRSLGIRLMAGIATQPGTGSLFGLTTFGSTPASSLIHIDISNGATITIGPTGLPQLVEGDLAFSPINGFLYGVQDTGTNGTQRNLFRISPTTGVATIVGSIGGAAGYSALAFTSTGTLYTIDTAGTGNSLLETIDQNTGAILTTTMLNVNLGPAAGLAINPLSSVAYVADGGGSGATNMLYQLNLNSGILTSIGPTAAPYGLAGLTLVSVPEPSSVVLMTSTLLFFGGIFFRRRKVRLCHRSNCDTTGI
jgi:hypothetical protein